MQIIMGSSHESVYISNLELDMYLRASLVAQTVKNRPAVQETPVQSLDEEDPWRRKWQPTLVFLPGKFHEQRSLAGYSPQACKESDLTERLTHTYISNIYLILNFTYFCFS